MILLAAIVSAALLQLFARCAPAVGTVTMSALVTYESGARPYAIGDNTARRSYYPSSRGRASAVARDLLRAGHTIDVGYAQINSRNFVAYGLNVENAFDPCTNVATGARILERAYAGAARRYGPGQPALAHALSAYNTGGYFAGLAYARGIYAIAATLRYEDVSRASARASAFRPSRFRDSSSSLAARHRR